MARKHLLAALRVLPRLHSKPGQLLCSFLLAFVMRHAQAIEDVVATQTRPEHPGQVAPQQRCVAPPVDLSGGGPALAYTLSSRQGMNS